MSSKGTDKSGRTRIQCSGLKERGTCSDPSTFYLDTVESAVFDALRAELRHPALLAEYAPEYHAERQRLAADAIAQRAELECRLTTIESEADRITDWLVKGVGDVERLYRRAKQLMEEEREVRAQLASAAEPQNGVTLHPQALARFEQQAEKLAGSLGRAIELGDEEAAEGIRELVRTVTVGRNDEGDLSIEIEGRLNVLLGLGSDRSRRVSGGKVVAEEGLEPPTPGL